MTAEQASLRAEQARPNYQLPESWKRLACERRYIEVADGSAEQPAPTRDLLVWVVRFGDYLGWAELAVDDGTGRVVRMERSR